MELAPARGARARRRRTSTRCRSTRSSRRRAARDPPRRAGPARRRGRRRARRASTSRRSPASRSRSTSSAGDEVFAGTLNAFGALTVRVTRGGRDSTLARVARWSPRRRAAARRRSASSTASRASTRRWCSSPRCCVAIVRSLLGGDLDTWVYRALALLIVACPCALVISVPVTVVSAIGGAARARRADQGRPGARGPRPRARGRDRQDRHADPRHAAAHDRASRSTTATTTRARAGGRRRSATPSTRSPRRSSAPRASAASTSRRPTRFEALPGRGAPRASSTAATCGPAARAWPRERARRVPTRSLQPRSAARPRSLLGEGDRVLAVFGLADQPRPRPPARSRGLRDAPASSAS